MSGLLYVEAKVNKHLNYLMTLVKVHLLRLLVAINFVIPIIHVNVTGMKLSFNCATDICPIIHFIIKNYFATPGHGCNLVAVESVGLLNAPIIF